MYKMKLFIFLYLSENYFKSVEHSSTRWAYIHGLCEKAIYGGRITNVQDIAILTTYLRCVFTSDNVNWKDGIPGIADLNSGDAKVCKLYTYEVMLVYVNVTRCSLKKKKNDLMLFNYRMKVNYYFFLSNIGCRECIEKRPGTRHSETVGFAGECRQVLAKETEHRNNITIAT